MINFDKIVKKMLNNWWNIIFKDDIFELIDPEKKSKYKLYLDKVIYRLKAENIIISIKAWVYIIPSDEDLKLNNIDLIDKYYLKLIKKYIISLLNNDYYISWNKALEFHMKDFSIPEKVFIITRNLNKKIKIGNYEIIFKTVSYNDNLKNKKNINLYSKLSNFVEIKTIDWIWFKISNLELSLVETALISDNNLGLNLNLLNRAIKKYSKVFDKSIFYEIGKYKFSMSFNRLKEISKSLDRELYLVFLDIIKKNGGLFIGEWLRRL